MNVSNPTVRLGQRNFLKMVLGGTKKESCLPECLFLWGPANSGKTHILNESLRKSSIDKRIEINCCEIMCGRRGFFDSILRQIKYEPESDDQLENIGRCDTLLTFTQQLSQYLHTDKSVIFIIDRPEFLFEQGCGDIFLILRNLRSYVQRHLCCIFTSRLPWSSFAQMTQCQAPIELQFPQYTSDEVFTIITDNLPSKINPEIYKNYVRLVLNVHYITCRDLNKLWKFVNLRQDQFFEPESKRSGQQLVLWRNIQSTLKKDIQKTNNSDIKVQEWIDHSSVNLPLCSVYLLIAAFIASVNPQSYDKRFFVKARSEGKKRRGVMSTVHKVLRGGFPHTRLIGIFAQISDRKLPLDSILLSNIATLISQGYLIRDGSLHKPKYRSNLSKEFVLKLSQNVNFDLDYYIYSNH